METDDKWARPGWRIEQKYGNKVLIGNWAEEKLQGRLLQVSLEKAMFDLKRQTWIKFTRDRCASTSTHRTDYRPQRDHRPDVFIRRDARRRAEGLPTKFLLDHHNIPHSHYLVSHYDETYGRQSASALPTRRSWHPDKLAWVPERSDHPAEAPPTNFGLAESQRTHNRKQAQTASHMLSVYRSAFPRHPDSAFCPPRRARTARALSSHLHLANRTNKDLELKGRPLLQVPDHPSRLLPPVSAPRTRGSIPSDSAWSSQLQ